MHTVKNATVHLNECSLCRVQAMQEGAAVQILHTLSACGASPAQLLTTLKRLEGMAGMDEDFFGEPPPDRLEGAQLVASVGASASDEQAAAGQPAAMTAAASAQSDQSDKADQSDQADAGHVARGAVLMVEPHLDARLAAARSRTEGAWSWRLREIQDALGLTDKQLVLMIAK